MRKTAFIVTVFSMLMTGCTEENMDQTENVLELTAQTETYTKYHSRTQVGETNTDGSIQMLWSPQDAIGVFGDSRNNVKFIYKQSTASSNAVFSGTFSGTPKYVYYPYSSSAGNSSAIPVTIPTEQSYKDVTSIANYDVKAGKITQSSGKHIINFQQLASLVRFEIDLSSVEGLSLEEGETLKRVELQAKNTLTGDFTIDLNHIGNGLTPKSDVSTTLNLIFEEEPELKGKETIVAYAVVVPGEHLNDEWECSIETSKHWIQFCTHVQADLEMGRFSVLPLNATVLENSYHYDEESGAQMNGPFIDSFEEEEPEVPVAPIGETANCYMISAPGSYSFPATVIGNGQEGIISGVGFHTETATISPKSVELLWQDTPGFITAVSLENGIVNYTAGGNVGNAQIAVKDNDGTILWSWHIWGTGDHAVEDEVYTNQAGATFTVMDRNLGQLKMVYSNMFPNDGSMYIASDNTLVSDLAEQLQPTYYSTCYQWGRKDPIPTSPTYYDLNGNVLGDISNSYPVHIASSAEEASISYSIKNPHKIIYASTLNNADWLATINQYLWGDNNSTTYYDWWSDGKLSNGGAGTSWSNQKSIYDPCPAGYRVANKWTFTGFVNSNQGTNSFSSADTSPEALNQYIKCITTTYLQAETTTRYVPVFCHGYFFKKNDSDTEGTYYPMTGYRNGIDGKSVGAGTQGYVWSSSRNSNSDSQSTSSILNIGAYNWYFEKTTGGHSGPNGTVNVVDFKNRLDALPVRCVRE